MAIQIQVRLDPPTLTQFLAELMPVTVDLNDADNDDHWLQLGVPDRVEFTAADGVRVHTTARLQWTIAGVKVPVTISSLSMRLMPVIASSPSGGRLNLLATVEDADLKHVPEFIENGIVARVNAHLEARPELLGWDYGKTLAINVAMPASLARPGGLDLTARNASVTVDGQAIRLSVELPMHFAPADISSAG